ncbi:MAG TPA: hypothetical protein VFU81_13090 [Thermomicrobiales bacterium]|nr:hypothetical protein [Thermomicrobiales bacterium]
MVGRWRSWLERTMMSRTPRTPEQIRQDRADTMEALRGEVRQLQQAIKDASDALDHALPGEARQGQQRQLAALERQLDQTQRELARYQARV